MKVVFINNSSESYTPTHSGAIATWVHHVAFCARAEGHTPIIISRECEHPPYPDRDAVFLSYPRIPTGRFGTLLCRLERKLDGWRNFRQRAYALRVLETVRALGISQLSLVLHNDPEMAVLLAERLPKARVLHVFHNHLDCKGRFRRHYAAAKVSTIAVSGFTARWIEERYQLPHESVSTIYNGVDIDHFAPCTGKRAQTHAVVGFVGRTGIEKGPDVLLRAALAAARTTRGFSVQLIGSNHWGASRVDAYQQQLSLLCRELSDAGIAVRQPGFVDRAQLPGEMLQSDIHVVPSRWDEPFGLTTLEGMSCGLAVIASATGGTPEVVGDSGLLFPREDWEALARHIVRLAGDPALRESLGRRARARALHFTWTRTWSALRDHLEHAQAPHRQRERIHSACTSAA